MKYYDFTFVAYEPVEQIGCYAFDGDPQAALEDFTEALQDKYGERQYKIISFKESENPDLFAYVNESQYNPGNGTIN